MSKRKDLIQKQLISNIEILLETILNNQDRIDNELAELRMQLETQNEEPKTFG